ncbi:MAG TPA: hypothetical protein PLS71_21020, partial [Leptospiraceae bacterium]|nr:hypothetical protein [Leptospiraceae bacterium]
EESKLPPDQRKGAKSASKKRTFDIVWRSALIPGWGLWKANKKWLAALVFVGVAGVGAYSVSKVNAFDSAGKTYESNSLLIGLYVLRQTQAGASSNQTVNLGTGIILGQAAFAPYGQAQTNGNNAIQALGFVYAVQLIHSIFVGRDYAKEEPAKGIGTKTAYGDINFNATPKMALTPSGLNRETYYELNYSLDF